MASNHEYSRLVSQTLDCMGYNKDMIKMRMDHYKEKGNTMSGPTCMTILTGSKGEGLSAPLQSDMDYMTTRTNIICTDDPQQFTNIPATTVFAMDSLNTPPGYTQLKLMKYGGQQKIYNSLIKSENRQWYLSSDIWVRADQSLAEIEVGTFQSNDTTILLQTAGPSSPFICNIGAVTIHSDKVSAITCFCQGMLDSWTRRQRNNNWPAQDLIQNICRTDSGYVVPVGFKGSDDQHIGWRICFTTAELKLIHNLNDTQTKVYILLKMVAKDIIQPVCKEITSYIMKNIILWIAEFNPQEMFREEFLVDMVIQSLCFLKRCVVQNILPSYMIPERNLLARKLDCHQTRQVASLLSDCIQTGGSILLRCEKLRVFMVARYITPEDTITYGKKRDLAECLTLLRIAKSERIYSQLKKNGVVFTKDQLSSLVYDVADRYIADMLWNLVVPDWREMCALGIDPTPLYDQRMKEFCS